jgi:ABC-type transporter Mla subunit MlaD
MHSHDDQEEEAFWNKIEELKNLEIQPDGAVVGKDFREVILRQMQLTHALSQRQHQDVAQLQEGVRQFTASSKRVEKLTLALIGLTGVLAVMTALLIPP